MPPDLTGYTRDELMSWIEYMGDKVDRKEREIEYLRMRVDELSASLRLSEIKKPNWYLDH